MTTDNTLAVEQCDRDAAADWLTNADLVTLERGEQSLVQAFARHRLSNLPTREALERIRSILLSKDRLSYDDCNKAAAICNAAIAAMKVEADNA